MKPLHALISKRNISNASSHLRITKKSDLRPGDMCHQNDGTFGVYIGFMNTDLSEKFNIVEDDVDTIIFLRPSRNIIGSKTWEHYPLYCLTEALKDSEGDHKYDMIEVIRGICDPNIVHDPDKLEDFLEDESKYIKYFK